MFKLRELRENHQPHAEALIVRQSGKQKGTELTVHQLASIY